MCGFAGVIVWDEKYRVMPETLRRMSAAVAHRGPDGERLRLTREHEPITPDQPQVALAFRRLAILDPDERSMQPFTDGRHWLVFNGEIYNFRELRSELSALKPEYEWRTTGDTEVLLLAYAVWGEQCVEKLNGMFAFAVWDEAERTLFLARDRMGQKPLYVAYLGRSGKAADHLNYHYPIEDAPLAIAFGSELSAIRPVEWWDRSVDEPHLAMYLSRGFITQGTIYRGVRQLEPARWMRITGRGVGIAPYFSICGQKHPDTATRRLTRDRVIEAVTRQLISDVPIGSFLSGGIDSSVITAAMRTATADVQTFSIGFDDLRYDETEYADRVAKHLGTRHHRFVVKPDACADLPRLAAVFGEPFGDSSALPTHYLARECRKVVKVALSGEGGDELFGGYDRYRALRLSEQIDILPIGLRKLMGDPAKLFKGGHPKSRLVRFRRFAAALTDKPEQRYLKYVQLFNDEQISKLLMHKSTPSEGIENLFAALNHRSDAVQCAVNVERHLYLPHDLLTKVDRCSMLHGLEVRSPFMDHELVQFAAGLTTDQLLKGGPKRMLREAFADDLPAWVFKRKKMGFAVPIGDWFRGPLRSMLRDTLFSAHAFGRSHFDMRVVERLVDEHESNRVDHSQRLYALLMLELWWDTVRTPA